MVPEVRDGSPAGGDETARVESSTSAFVGFAPILSSGTGSNSRKWGSSPFCLPLAFGLYVMAKLLRTMVSVLLLDCANELHSSSRPDYLPFKR